ncbi:conserved Plasmodium protein, unknown function [Plasmodium berghei]|uniref:Uncharacterized protein n=2 Tax=Plasmodium berghei TaxID=5821 RepID=A0A509AV05_PLABA|nr:conserved protein, unknown function [Plasmodium berghei ANKA]CXI81897.1 conserved Plasmodium protein, unknown function [Plasmodium berghei]SCM25560.1 conserved Plasmodium protein, unknown function [Plasmodium berghei]SCN27404.1 conserved Plasmodium protein, unknown function [Plasmodium berghei]SCO62079.1 conserved Plasmodium protein, unknown function [Plasmodium berghei]SCO63831.1 conserved Plasmodium protein, unknown function [Plasmodium berghei]|eukprot:XP_034423037.1 conserved protein, unknown function [Plasmodium berghei ANKA]
MTKIQIFFFIFFIFLKVIKCKKSNKQMYSSFVSVYNNDSIFSPLNRKHIINVSRNDEEKRYLKYSNNNNINKDKDFGNLNWQNVGWKKNHNRKKKICMQNEKYNDDKNFTNNFNDNSSNNILSEINKNINNEYKPDVVNCNNIDITSEDKEVIASKFENKKNEFIQKVKFPIIGTQLKPSGGFAKEILNIIRESNDYINIVNEEIIQEKLDKKVKGNDLSFFDTENTLEQHEIKYLQKVYDNNHVLNIYNFLLVWKEKKNVDLSVFVSKITENSNLLPGERTVIKFTEIEKVQFLKKIRKNKNVCIAMIFVDNKNTSNNNETSVNHNMFPIGILSHPLDISLLDRCGEISVLNLYRFKINNYNVTDTDFIVNAELFVDNNKRLKNYDLTHENKKVIMNLYDKLLELKIKYNEKIGKSQENEKLKHLEKITERIDEYVNVLNINKSIHFKNNTNLDFYTSLYLEYLSFMALDINANIQTKLQMMYTDNTELRLHTVKTYLMQLYDDLKEKLKGL